MLRSVFFVLVFARICYISTADEDCPLSITNVNENCIDDSGEWIIKTSGKCERVMYMFEDCPQDTKLFNIDANDDGSEPEFQISATKFTLKEKPDAESNENPIFCNIEQDNAKITIYFKDIEETLVRTDLTDVCQEVNENNDIDTLVVSFNVLDDDLSQLEKMTYALEPDSVPFTLVPVGECKPDAKQCRFELRTSQVLDYESTYLYAFKMKFTTKDSRDNTSTITPEMRVSVKDLADTPPVWTQTVPRVELPESEQVQEVFKFVAMDGDSLGNVIEYSIGGGNEKELFKIDQQTGTLSTTGPLDRDAPAAIKEFTLEIVAKETVNGKPAEKPNTSSTEVKIVVTDINDSKPTFVYSTDVVTVDELVSSSATFDWSFTVTDADAPRPRPGPGISANRTPAQAPV